MGTLRTYLTGFGLSLLLTSAAFGAVWAVLAEILIFSGRETAVLIVVGLAVIQLFVQLRFFLHIGQERQRRWNIIIFAFALLVVIILVVGTLWIMNNVSNGQMTIPTTQIIEKENMPNIQMPDMQLNTHE